jgi:ankyrin repeat protein
VESGADVNAKNSNGWTTLMFLCYGGIPRPVTITDVSQFRFDLVKEVVAKGADVDARNNGGKNALEILEFTGYSDLVRALAK